MFVNIITTVPEILKFKGGGGVRSMLTVAGRGRGCKIYQNLADVICERSLS